MPFAIFCDHCRPEVVIGQGVRFNAEKKKIGNYFTTAIWSFRIKHSICGGWIEIRTNPKEGRYEVVEGARRRDGREEEEFGGRIFENGEGEGRMITEEERERRRNDAFAALEGKVGEKGVEKKSKDRIEKLVEAQDRTWADPDEINRRLRRGFRKERKVLEKRALHAEGMQERFGIGFEIADEVEGDRIKAGLIEFGDIGLGRIEAAVRRPLFASETALVSAADKKKNGKGDKNTWAAREAEKRRQLLQHELRGNTREVLDPFLPSSSRARPTDTAIKVIAGIKRKRLDESKEPIKSNAIETHSPTQATGTTTPQPNVSKTPALLVAYDSD
jgi:coiled-coil domain-containing protein 130